MPDSITLSSYPARELVTAGRRPGFRPVASYLDRIPLGTEVGLGPGDIALDGDPVPPRKWAQQPLHFSAHFVLARSPISATAELLLCIASFTNVYGRPM